jgi:hypothetical protein
MATQVKTVSGNTTTYTLTDEEGSTLAVALTQGFGSGRTIVFTSTGGLHSDGQLQLTVLMEMLSTGLTP